MVQKAKVSTAWEKDQQDAKSRVTLHSPLTGYCWSMSRPKWWHAGGIVKSDAERKKKRRRAQGREPIRMSPQAKVYNYNSDVSLRIPSIGV